MKDPIILQTGIVAIGLLTFAQVVTKLIEVKNPHKDLTEVKVRIRSWWIMIFVLELALYSGKRAIIGLIACVSFFALREFLSCVPTRICDRRVLFWAFLSIPIQFLLCYEGWLIPFLVFIPLYGMSLIAIRLLLTGQPRGFVLSLSTFQLGLMTTVYSISHIVYLPFLQESHYDVAAGTLLFFYALTQSNDVFQFVSGKTFGKNKIIPLISPKKTIEGFVGGAITTTIAAAIVAPYLTQLTPLQGAAAGAVMSIFGFFGDVLLSAIKRDLEIKDFSQIIPGHGGILDRIDSLVISAPLYFHLIRFLTERS